MVDFLATKGEFTPEDLAELQAMTQAELVAFTIGLSKSWYQLLESLEEAHRQDLERLSTQLEKRFQEGLRTTTASHTAQLTGVDWHSGLDREPSYFARTSGLGSRNGELI